MATALAKLGLRAPTPNDQLKEFVTVKIDNQLFGFPVDYVQDVFKPQKITKIPLTSEEIAGCLNLRGRIVTVIDMRIALGLKPTDLSGNLISVVVEHKGELYSLLVDSVGDVMKLYSSMLENTPANVPQKWSAVSSGVYQLEKGLLVIVNIDLLLNFK